MAAAMPQETKRTLATGTATYSKLEKPKEDKLQR